MRLLFDRGTLLLVDTPSELDPETLPGVLWDPRVGVYRAPAFLWWDITGALRELEVPLEHDGRTEDGTSASWSRVELRPYQESALLAWELADRRGLVVLPTGAGKTRLALSAMASTRARTLVLVPTRALLHQWRAEIERFYRGSIGVWGDGDKSLAPVTVVTFESAHRYMDKFGAAFDLLVVDEAHHFGDAVRDDALEMSLAPMRLGLTATPPEGPSLEGLEALVGPIVYQLGVQDLAGTYLAPFDLVVMRLRLDDDERRVYFSEVRLFRRAFLEFREHHPGAEWRDFVAAAGRTAEGRRALAAWRKSRKLLGLTRSKARAVKALLSRHRESRVLVFTADNQAAYTIAKSHLIMPITCEIGRKERERALDWFRKGEVRALVSTRVLNEGIDVPDADVAIIVGGTFGEREHVQRIGRLLRPAPDKRAIIYELVTIETAEARTSARRRRSVVLVANAGL